MSVLKTLHDELVDFEERFHELVNPEQVIGEKVRELVKASVAEIARMSDAVAEIARRVCEIGEHPALSIPPLPPADAASAAEPKE